jgi:hypothetical protein
MPAPITRRYTDRFFASGTRYVCWEIDLSYNARTTPGNFAVEAIWYGPDGAVKTRQTVDVRMNAGWSGSNHASGWGSDNGHSFSAGQYRVDFLVSGQIVARGTFAVE